MKPFSESTYLSQVRRLTELARSAAQKFPIRLKKLEFIHHGENTTFKILGHNDQRYLLRVHRPDYHSRSALQEEMSWLSALAQKGQIQVPKPLRSKRGSLIEVGAAKGVPEERNVTVFHWIEGRFINKSVRPAHLFELGKIIAELQHRRPTTRHRKYWTADGLLGPNCKFGPVDHILGCEVKDQKQIVKARNHTYKALKAFERKFPDRSGVIHADLHFGNILQTRTGLAIIDFDDSGFGFLAYDLAIPLISLEYTIGLKKLAPFKAALIDGYRLKAHWDQTEDEILTHLITARKIAMLGWLNLRADNPRLKKYIKTAIRRLIQHLNFTEGRNVL